MPSPQILINCLVCTTCLMLRRTFTNYFDKMLYAISLSPEGEQDVDQEEEEIKIIGKIHEML